MLEFVEVSNLMAGDVLGSSGIFVYGCVYLCNSCSVWKGFLKHGICLLLNLLVVLISFWQSATGINFGLHDHRNKTEVLGKVLVFNRKGEPRLT